MKIILENRDEVEELIEQLESHQPISINGLEYLVSTVTRNDEGRTGHAFLHELPIKRQAPWTGEGLPPEGEWCEILSTPEPKGRWCKGKILYISKSSCVWCWDEKQIDMCTNTFEMKFRPIRTPEQIAVEIRSKAITQLMCDLDVPTAIATRAYDAGYRKA